MSQAEQHLKLSLFNSGKKKRKENSAAGENIESTLMKNFAFSSSSFYTVALQPERDLHMLTLTLKWTWKNKLFITSYQ